MTKKILMAAGNHWLSPIQVGDHHLARCFVDDGWFVGFLSSPISPFHVLGHEREDYRQRLPLWYGGGRYFESGQMWSHVPGALVVPRRTPPFHSEWLIRNWYRLTVPRLRSRLREVGLDHVDVLHIRDVKFAFLLDVVGYDYCVFRWADNDRGFPQFSKACHSERRRLVKRATHVYYTAQSLEMEVAALAPAAAMYLPNGVALGRFTLDGLERPSDLGRIPDPIALYVGSIDEWFDFNLVRFAATQLPSVSFVLIGPPRLAQERLAGLRNVHVLGRRAHDSIPAYLQHASVGLIPFDVGAHGALVNAINPVKLYEYLAAGLPTVAVSWEELRRINPPASLTKTRREFIDAIAESIRLPPDRDTLRAFAQHYDWRNVYAQLREFVGA